MQNMLIWIRVTTLENVTKQWRTGSNKTLQFMPRFTQPELKTPSGVMQMQLISYKDDFPGKRTSIFTEPTVIKPSTNIQLPYSPDQAPSY